MIGALALALSSSGDAEPPTEIVVLPAGPWVETRDGRAWTLPDAAAVAERSNALLGDQEAVVDYEHQSLDAQRTGQPAPAAGWISRFRVTPQGAVAAVVRWTEKAAKFIADGEYRYVSPAFKFDEATREILAVYQVGLTNSPALPDIPAVARQRLDEVYITMNVSIGQLLALLGLDETADQQAVEAVLAKLRSDGAAAARAEIAEAAGLPEDADGATLAAGIAALRARPAGSADPDPAQWVPRTEFDAAAKRLSALEESTATASATAAVDAAVKSGKVTPANRGWALGYAKQDPDGFAQFVGAAPTILQSGETAPSPAPNGLTADEIAVCRTLGLTEDEMRAQKQRVAA